jgi:hypothetical protein
VSIANRSFPAVGPVQAHSADDSKLQNRTYPIQSKFARDLVVQLAAVYFILFFLIGAWSVLTDLRGREPIAEVAAEAIAFSILSVGNCFWLIGLRSASVASIWYIAIVVAVCSEIFAVICDRRRHIATALASAEDENELQEFVLFADVGTVLLFIPAVVINLIFAGLVAW